MRIKLGEKWDESGVSIEKPPASSLIDPNTGMLKRVINKKLAYIMDTSFDDLEWSHDRGLNPRPHPYHGCALPTELSWRNRLNFSILSRV